MDQKLEEIALEMLWNFYLCSTLLTGCVASATAFIMVASFKGYMDRWVGFAYVLVLANFFGLMLYMSS